MSHLPWFPFYHLDWKRSRKVRAMPRHCRSMFLDLLGELWEQGPIPNDPEAIANLLGENPKTFDKDWAKLRPCFVEVDGHLVNERLEEIRAEQTKKSRKQAERAANGWNTRRAKKERQNRGDAAASPWHSPGYAIPDPRSQREDTDVRVPPKRTPTMVALCSAWVDGGLVGTIGLSHPGLAELADELDARSIAPLDACKAWRRMLESQGTRGVLTKQNPQKMLESVRDGRLLLVIAGKVNLDPQKPGGRPAPPPSLSHRDADDVLEEDERREAERARQRAAVLGGVP